MPRLNYVSDILEGSFSVFKWSNPRRSWDTSTDYKRPMTDSEKAYYIGKIRANQFVIDSSLPSKELNVCSRSPDGWLKGYAALISGVSQDPPNFDLDVPQLKEGINNLDFCARQRRGEMVVSPYSVRSVSFGINYGARILSARQLPSQCLVTPETFPEYFGNMDNRRGIFIDMGSGELGYFSMYLRRSIGEVEMTAHPFETGLTVDNLKSAFHGVIHPPVDPAWVQSAHAEANGRCVDWLTTLAELPETIKQVFTAMRALGRALKGWKNREKSIREEWSQYVSRLKKRISDLTNQLAKAKSVTLVRNLRRKLKKLNKEYSRKGKKLIDMLTSGWMTYRYGVMPYVYLVQDILKVTEKRLHTAQFLATRDKCVLDVEAPQFEGFDFTGIATCEAKLMIKYKYEPALAKLRDLTRVASSNVALTLWELGTRTFVWDWFFTVGDALSAGFGTPSDAVEMAATLSYKTEIRGKYVNRFNGSSIDVDYSAYKRDVPDLGSFRGIYFRPNLNWKRYVDSFAMLWPSIKRSVR